MTHTWSLQSSNLQLNEADKLTHSIIIQDRFFFGKGRERNREGIKEGKERKNEGIRGIREGKKPTCISYFLCARH